MDDLVPMPEGWETALAVVAHPDDLEYGASGAIARWTAQGKVITYLLATRGEAGIDWTAPEEAGPVREREQIASAAVVGVRTVEFLDHHDGLVTYGLPLRRDIAAAIRRHKPDVVITGNHHEEHPGGHLNMADHRVVGQAAIDAVRDAANRWVFRELELEPWGGVQHVAVSGSPQATHAVDITDTLSLSVASLREHTTYLAALSGDMADPERFLRRMAEMSGQRFGGRLAASFELLAM